MNRLHPNRGEDEKNSTAKATALECFLKKAVKGWLQEEKKAMEKKGGEKILVGFQNKEEGRGDGRTINRKECNEKKLEGEKIMFTRKPVEKGKGGGGNSALRPEWHTRGTTQLCGSKVGGWGGIEAASL